MAHVRQGPPVGVQGDVCGVLVPGKPDNQRLAGASGAIGKTSSSSEPSRVNGMLGTGMLVTIRSKSKERT